MSSVDVDPAAAPPPDAPTSEQKARAISIRPSGENKDAPPGDDFGEPVKRPDGQAKGDDFAEPLKPVDYKTGADFGMRVAMQRSDNPEEAKKLMENSFGKDNVGQDKKGNWFYKKGDERVAVFPDEAEGSLDQFVKAHPILANVPMGPGMPSVQGVSKITGLLNKVAPRLSESIVASANPMAGVTAGATAGGVMGGPFGAAVGGGVGYAIGKGLDDMVKELQGFRAKNWNEEVATMLGPEAAINMLQPGTGQIARAFKTKGLGVTPESSRMTQEVMEEGARPPVGSVATEASGLEMKRKLSKEVSGDMHRAQNVAWLEKSIKKFLEDTGVPSHEAHQMIQEMWAGSSAIEGKHAAKSLVDAAKRQHDALSIVASKHLADAKEMTDNIEKLLRMWSGGAPRDMGVDLGQRLLAARMQFGKDMNQVAARIHQMIGGPVVPADEAIATAKKLIAVSPPETAPAFVNDLARMEPGALLTIEQAHNYRTFSREAERGMTRGGNLTPGTDYHYLSEMEKAIDNGISTVASQTEGDVGNALKAFDKQYREGIVTFKNAKARNLINDIQKGAVPEPYVVARDILEAGSMQDVLAVRRYLSPEQVENVGKAFTENLLRASSTEASDQSAQLVISPAALLKNIERYQDVMHTFGISPKFTGELKEFANSLRARNERLNPEFLRQGPIRQKLAEWHAAQEILDGFVKNNPLAAFRSGNAAAHDAALNFVMTRSNWEKIKPVLGAMSPEERQTLHQYAIARLFNDVTETTPERLKTVKGDAIKGWLSKYTSEQQDALLGYGIANDLTRLGDKVNFVFRGDDLATGGSQAAVSVQSKGFFHPLALHKRMQWFFTTLVVHQPALLSWLADLSERDPTMFRLVANATNRWIATAAMTDPRSGTPGMMSGGYPKPQTQPGQQLQ